MNELLAPLRRYLAERSTRERWLLIAAGCVTALMFVYLVLISPLEQRARASEAQTDELQSQVLRALSIASEMRGLQGELADVEGRIQPGAKTNLIALLSTLAADAKISQEQHFLHTVMMVLCTVIFVAVFAVMFYSIWKHRKSVGHKAAAVDFPDFTKGRWKTTPPLAIVHM